MALIQCSECGRDVSERAAACPGCGAPVEAGAGAARAPDRPHLRGDRINATRAQMVELAKAAIKHEGHRLESVDADNGTASFTTGMTMGSFSGVTATITWRETEPYLFSLEGSGKQNVRGGQLVAIDLFGEARAKVDQVMYLMRAIAEKPSDDRTELPQSKDSTMAWMMVAIFAVLVFIVLFGGR